MVHFFYCSAIVIIIIIDSITPFFNPFYHLFLSYYCHFFSTAFCAVRPPGHHAETDRACGFCFFNNAGIGARYAQEKYGVKNVAVLDFDVHHGNGTEEGFTPNDTLFYGSTHEKDNFPGTGVDPSPYIGDKVKDDLHRRIVNRTIGRGHESVKEFRIKWAQIIEEMVLFRPDLIIFSAGFDAHDEDPLADVELLEEDFEWATEIVMKACVRIDPLNPVPVMSVLEGGYDLTALADSTVVHVNALARGYPIPAIINATINASTILNVESKALKINDINIDDKNEKYNDSDNNDNNNNSDNSNHDHNNVNNSDNNNDCDENENGPSKYGGDEVEALKDHIKSLNLL